MNAVVLTLRQSRYDMRAFWRNSAAALFTFVFPLMFLVMFDAVLGNQDFATEGGEIDGSTFYVPAILAFSVITACYTNIAMSVTVARDRGVLKRVRGTPLPVAVFLVGRILQAVAVAVMLVVLVLAAGIALYGVELESDRVPALCVSLVVGAAAFCALGLALAGFVPNAEGAPAVVNFSVLPLLFISDIFIPTVEAPAWLNHLASIFPVAHFAEAMHAAFNPYETGAAWEVKDLAIMAAWGVAGVAVALRYFTWEPRR